MGKTAIQGDSLTRRSLDGGQQFRRRHVESVGELDDYIEGRVPPSAFQPADIGAVEADVVCEGFLGYPSVLLAQIAKALAKRDAMRCDAPTHSYINVLDTLTMSPRTISHIAVSGVAAAIESVSGCSKVLEETDV